MAPLIGHALALVGVLGLAGANRRMIAARWRAGDPAAGAVQSLEHGQRQRRLLELAAVAVAGWVAGRRRRRG